MSDQTPRSDSIVGNISRRGLLRAAGYGAAVIGGGGLLEACSSGIKGASSGSASTKAITIGWIHPLTGPLAGFGAPDNWVISKIKATTPYKKGFKIGGKTYPVTIKSYDSQSSVTRAGDLARTAILSDNVDMLFASSTPETVNAVASQAETLGTPLVCANCPWESWYLNLFPNDPDGDAFRAVFPPIVTGAGYTFDMSTAYPDGTTNYTSMITQFKADKADFFTNVPLPPDFAAMWHQSIQQGFRPKLATVAKVLLFPTDAYAMGAEAYNIATDTWWVPTLPWTSTFTGESCQTMANEYEAAVGSQWNANISNYSLFEIAHAALTSVTDPHDHSAVADAIHNVNIQALAGPLNFASGGPAPGVAITPPAGVQWQKGSKYALQMQIVDNTLLPQAKITADLLPTNT